MTLPRPYESNSSIGLHERCGLAYVLTYGLGIREPEIPWATLTLHPDRYSPSQKSTSLGKECHGRGEAYFGGQPVDWTDLPGQIAALWIPLLPKRGVGRVEIEQPLGHGWPLAKLVTDANSGERIPALPMAGTVPLVGYIDLLFVGVSASAVPGWRLGALPGGVLIVDLKTSSDVKKWAVKATDLGSNLQTCAYAVAICRRFKLDRVAVRWAYSGTKRRESDARDSIVGLHEAEAVLAQAAASARSAAMLATATTFPANVLACDQYGGCYHCEDYHPDGACPVWRNSGQRIARLNPLLKEYIIMAGLSPETQAKLDAIRNKTAQPTPIAAAVAAAASVATAPKARAPRKTPAPQATPEPAEVTDEPCDECADDPIAEAYVGYQQAKAALDEATVACDNARARLAQVSAAE